ncbi:Uncharacterised protein [Yersinia similis]|uniref:Uncharacterized protein n=1 Tax=Yersinia similis TaxID=367190 RepID=A0A0T9PDB0_9GAMM|nr:Uncharacterised protein [Yersinia similis]CNF74299.1 Uncharacterised protein [Yersinia similis]CNH58764.1 Uncharacterised protein [Yersinia similis]
MDAERGPLEHGGESARSVSEMMNRGTPHSGQAIVRKGATLMAPLAVGSSEAR